MSSTIDHLVLAGGDLDYLVEWFAGVAGQIPSPGGSHPGLGTRNALVGLKTPGEGPNAYLELVGPDPDQDQAPSLLPFGIGGLGPQDVKLATFAVSVVDIDATVAALAATEAVPGSVVEMSRTRPDGVTLSWKVAMALEERQQGVIPFLIEWGPRAVHPTESLAMECELGGLTLQHPEPDFVAGALADLDLNESTKRLIDIAGGQPAIVTATLVTPNGTLLL